MLQLHDYQNQMADFIVERLFVNDQHGVGLFADLGTGKTAASLRALKDLLDLGVIHKCLICAPLRVIYNTWPQEIQKWEPQLTWENLHKKTVYKSTAQIELINHDSLHKMIEHAGRWDCFLLDESTGLKRWTTRRMKAARKLLPSIPKRIILTGTPTPESLSELHSQIFVLDNGQALGKNVTVFRARFMDRGGWKGRQWILRKGCEKELLDLVTPLVMRVDAASHLDMPKLIENDIWISLPPDVMVDYRKLKRLLFLELEQGNLLVGNAAALYGKLKQFANGIVYNTDEQTGERTSVKIHAEKLTALEEIIGELNYKPAIILPHFKHDFNEILNLKCVTNYAVVDGSTSTKDSSIAIEKWNARKLRFLIAHPKCLSHGLNLQGGGSDMIWYGLPDSCEQYIQARARLWRQGQTEQVRNHRIVCRDTVEELQLERLNGKMKNQEDFLNALKAHAKE